MIRMIQSRACKTQRKRKLMEIFFFLQTATQHQQPMMNPTLPPGYAYAFTYGSGIMPGGFQYGTPAIYPVDFALFSRLVSNNERLLKSNRFAL